MMAPSATATAGAQLNTSLISVTDVHFSALEISAETLSHSERQQLAARLSKLAGQLTNTAVPLVCTQLSNVATQTLTPKSKGASVATQTSFSSAPPGYAVTQHSSVETLTPQTKASKVANEQKVSYACSLRPARGRARWMKRIREGRELVIEEIDQFGQDPLCAYLTMMGVSLSREQRRSVDFLRDKLRETLRETGEIRWRV